MYADGVSKKPKYFHKREASSYFSWVIFSFSVLLPEEEETQLHTLTCLENNGNVERLYSERTSAVTRNFQGGFHSSDVSIRKCFLFRCSGLTNVENMRPPL